MSEIVVSRLKELEQVIEKGFPTFVEVGKALAEIQQKQLYLPTHKTFEDYMLYRWGWTGRQGYHQIAGAKIGGFLSDNVNSCSQIPTNEGQIRPLSRIRTEERELDFPRILEAWQDACYLASEDGRPPTAREVKWIVDEMISGDSPPLPEGNYNVIYADPPWQFDNSGLEQSAASHYPTMKTTDICILPISKYGASVLFLWATNAMLPDALEVMRTWGFEYKSNIVWHKARGPSIGWFVRSRHELLLIGTARPGAHPIERPISIISAPVAEHSRKPNEFYELIQSMYLGPYLELFARRRYSDEWIAWGNEIGQKIRD